MKQSRTPKELKSYDVALPGYPWETINSLSPGQAKSEYYRSLDMDGVPYTAIKVRVNGLPYTSDDFIRNAKYRKIEFAYCGMAVKVGEWNGVIVGHNSSANLDILAIDGKYAGQVVNCHPHSNVTYYDKKGNVIKEYKH